MPRSSRAGRFDPRAVSYGPGWAAAAVAKAGSYRAAAREWGVSKDALYRLLSGRALDLSDKNLAKVEAVKRSLPQSERRQLERAARFLTLENNAKPQEIKKAGELLRKLPAADQRRLFRESERKFEPPKRGKPSKPKKGEPGKKQPKKLPRQQPQRRTYDTPERYQAQLTERENQYLQALKETKRYQVEQHPNPRKRKGKWLVIDTWEDGGESVVSAHDFEPDAERAAAELNEGPDAQEDEYEEDYLD